MLALEAELVELTGAAPTELLGLELDPLQQRVAEVLETVSARLRELPRGRSRHDVVHRGPVQAGPCPSYRGEDLAGRDLRRWTLCDADLRGALLIRADVRGQDLGRADLLGADLRDADLRGTDLAEVLFLSQSQLNAARGDANTAIPDGLTRPAHWR